VSAKRSLSLLRGLHGLHLICQALQAELDTAHERQEVKKSHGFCWRIPCCVEFTELSTNKQHTLSLATDAVGSCLPSPAGLFVQLEAAVNVASVSCLGSGCTQ
jgi:hypothetical protein